MKTQINSLGQSIGYAIDAFIAPPLPNFIKLEGATVHLKPVSIDDLSSLYQAFSLDTKGANWTYLPYGPFKTELEFIEWAKNTCFTHDPKFYTIFNASIPVGLASYLRIDHKVGCIEIGHIHFSPKLQQTRAGTEALLLMIEWAFEAGYRRLEWKCDSLNTPSRQTAERLGFSYEGTFRQATIYKSRNRDTSWYAMTSEDWPRLKAIYHTWCCSDNFKTDGQQIKSLSALTKSFIPV